MYKDYFGITLLLLFFMALFCGMFYGYVNNVVLLVNCDFKAPYKAEALRIIGVLVPPIGAIEGFVTINDN